jgi:two-component system phosphate regulon sensor histidine kinase PhoR
VISQYTKRSEGYKKSYSLVFSFLILILASTIVSSILAYNLTKTFVEGEFNSKKVEVLEETIKPYNDFFQNKIPEITSYQGFLDSSSASKYAQSVFKAYPFVKEIVYYDLDMSNHPDRFTYRHNNLSINEKAIYLFSPVRKDSILYKEEGTVPYKNNSDFYSMASKVGDYIREVDTLNAQRDEEVFSAFWEINTNKITYFNIPRRSELKQYKNMLNSDQLSPIYPQDMVTFYLDPYLLDIKNTNANLYQSITIRPIVYVALDNEQQKITTDITLPAAFSDYKLHFRSEKRFIENEVKRRFTPLFLGILTVYLFISVIAWLIYRNMNINLKLFKLQYDFINNFTHEFKTPVSVIKIAGSNLRSSSPLTERQRMHYGKILDEE